MVNKKHSPRIRCAEMESCCVVLPNIAASPWWTNYHCDVHTINHLPGGNCTENASSRIEFTLYYTLRTRFRPALFCQVVAGAKQRRRPMSTPLGHSGGPNKSSGGAPGWRFCFLAPRGAESWDDDEIDDDENTEQH